MISGILMGLLIVGLFSAFVVHLFGQALNGIGIPFPSVFQLILFIVILIIFVSVPFDAQAIPANWPATP